MASRYWSVVLAVKRATSSCPRMAVMGVRSSCDTSAENCLICWKEASRRALLSGRYEFAHPRPNVSGFIDSEIFVDRRDLAITGLFVEDDVAILIGNQKDFLDVADDCGFVFVFGVVKPVGEVFALAAIVENA